METVKHCFVIGPMNEKHMPFLNWLAQEIIRPILEPHGFTVSTPDIPETGNIMYHVIRSCDRAQLVVADITGNNPNVLYELAVLDAMGRPCIPVKIKMGASQEEKQEDRMPFDRAQYRFVVIDRNKPNEAAQLLKKLIEDVLKKHEAGDMFDNPLTDYFGVPLSSFSSAYGLARGYYHNLVMPVVEGLYHEKKFDGLPSLADEKRRRRQLHLQCVIPAVLDNARRSSLDYLVREGLISPVQMEAGGRKVFLYAWPEAEPIAALVDIPTTLYALRQVVEARLGPNKFVDPDSPEYKMLEADEISQFRRHLQGFINSGDTDTEAMAKRIVQIVDWGVTPLKDINIW